MGEANEENEGEEGGKTTTLQYGKLLENKKDSPLLIVISASYLKS